MSGLPPPVLNKPGTSDKMRFQLPPKPAHRASFDRGNSIPNSLVFPLPPKPKQMEKKSELSTEKMSQTSLNSSSDATKTEDSGSRDASPIKTRVEADLKPKNKRPKSKSFKRMSGIHASNTLRFFSKKDKTSSDPLLEQKDAPVIPKPEEPENQVTAKISKESNPDFRRNSLLIASALKNRPGIPPPPMVAREPETPPDVPPPTQETEILTVGSSFNKARVARVEFGPENTSKAINITPRTSPLEAFEGMMNKLSKGLPPERRDTLVAKYAKYTLYRLYENGEIEQIYAGEPLLSPMQIVGTKEMPKFLFTDQKVDAVHREGTKELETINFGSVMQETHMKEEQKAFNAVDEILMTERKFLFDTDLIIEMVLRPICDGDIIPAKTRNQIFLNIQQINSFHRELYRRFQIDNSISGIASVFDFETIEYLKKVYTTYLGYYEAALDVFYSTRDHSEKFRKFLAKLSTESPVFKDKSLNNLLVTPMQRVCKYELLLRNVISQERKRPEPDEVSVKKLTKIMKQLNVALQLIDKRRVETDEWNDVCKLESKIGFSEPLRQAGRIIIAETYVSCTRHDSSGSSVTKSCTVILFNDMVLRVFRSKMGDYKVLDQTRLDRIFVVDPRQTYATEPHCLTLCNIDPRGATLDFHFTTQEERKDFLSFLVVYVPSTPTVCKAWGIPDVGILGTEVVYRSDICSWDEAYIDNCRILVLRCFFILIWESFGITQNEVIPLSAVTDIETTKLGGILVKTNLWKESYHFHSFNHFQDTSTILCNVKKNYTQYVSALGKEKMQEAIEVDTAPLEESKKKSKFNFSKSESKQLWKHGSKAKYEAGHVILDFEQNTKNLFMLKKGGAVQCRMGGKIRELAQGNLFGIETFLGEHTFSKIRVVAGAEGATISSLNQEQVNLLLQEQPLLVAKLFAECSKEVCSQ